MSSTDSTDATTGAGDVTPGAQISDDEAAGDAISGVRDEEDGVPTPTGSVPPGPVATDDVDVPDATTLPPLSERMY